MGINKTMSLSLCSVGRFLCFLMVSAVLVQACKKGPPPSGQSKEFPWQGNAAGIEFIQVASGQFQMGSDREESLARPVHTVVLTQGFWVGKYEVTQSQFLAVMGSNPSSSCGDDLPADQVTWDDATEFCRLLTEGERKEGRLPQGMVYRLPTEAEWEYCCRAGEVLDCPASLESLAWYRENSQQRLHTVGTRSANSWGVHDMLGNVREWCSDWCAPYPDGRSCDPLGPAGGSARISRGGSVGDGASACTCSSRDAGRPDKPLVGHGFRVVLGRPAHMGVAREPPQDVPPGENDGKDKEH